MSYEYEILDLKLQRQQMKAETADLKYQILSKQVEALSRQLSDLKNGHEQMVEICLQLPPIIERIQTQMQQNDNILANDLRILFHEFTKFKESFPEHRARMNFVDLFNT